jgi:8-oxo-dGTP diphosphatase
VSHSVGIPPAPRPELAVGAVAVAGGALLLVRRATPPQVGRWTLPGGRVEGGETLARALEREVAEETGLSVRCGELVGWVERISDEHHFVILDFTVRVEGASEENRPVAGGDASEAAWVPLAGLDEVALVDGLADFLRQHGVV